METNNRLERAILERQDEFQISFEALIRFFNNQPDEKFSYDQIYGNIGKEGRTNFSGNLYLLIVAGYIYDEGLKETYTTDHESGRFSLITSIPPKLNRSDLSRKMSQESDLDRLFRRLKTEEIMQEAK